MRTTPAAARCITAAALLALFGGAAASAAPTLALSDAAGNPNAATVAAGDSFTVTLSMTADRTFQGYTIHLADPGYATTARLTIGSRARLASNPFTDPNGGTIANDPVDAMTKDLGYTADAGNPAVAPGTYALMTLTIATAAGLAPGTYTVGYNGASVLTDASFGDVSFAGSTPYAVTVVAAPEPAALAAATLALAGLAARRRRR